MCMFSTFSCSTDSPDPIISRPTSSQIILLFANSCRYSLGVKSSPSRLLSSRIGRTITENSWGSTRVYTPSLNGMHKGIRKLLIPLSLTCKPDSQISCLSRGRAALWGDSSRPLQSPVRMGGQVEQQHMVESMELQIRSRGHATQIFIFSQLSMQTILEEIAVKMVQLLQFSMCKEFTTVSMQICEVWQFIIRTSCHAKDSSLMLATSLKFWMVWVLAYEEASREIRCSYSAGRGILGEEPKMLVNCASDLPLSSLKRTPRILKSACVILTISEVGSLDTNFKKILRLRLINIKRLFCQLVKNRERFARLRGEDIGEKLL